MKKVFKILLVVLGILAIIVAFNYSRLNIISGYSAKNMSSSVFVAGRSVAFTDNTDNNFGPINIADDVVDQQKKTASASVFGLMERTAIYRKGLGSVLIDDEYDVTKKTSVPARTNIARMLPYPYGNMQPKDSIFSNIDYQKLQKAVEYAFAEENGEDIKKTRAVLVLYKDHLIAEKYADGLDKDSKLLGWSMTKSLLSTMYGVLQYQGKINVWDKAPVEAWANDERNAITIHNLLQMNSGLEWEEDYTKISDVTEMLFLAKDMTQPQAEKPLVGKPNETWYYSSGTSNLLSGILRKQFNSHQEYLDFPYRDFIDKIGMHSMLIEADMEGNYVGSSYGWANPRDWAKFGLLYLHKGNWNGTQIFDESWVDYVTKPTPTSEGRYGAHFWLNAGGFHPDVPKDMYSANGYQGQRVYIIPSKDLVVVRFGLAGGDYIDFNKFLSEICESVK
ncbi:serine hydrolase domain-containing protein [Kordia zhangzhouensis]|uniref:serine hydrolase domain-containing protein n=1 Tax=Kordia zhangzhouensis TaxID=1620405 RepID=UPI00062978FD|nr:serine hydrolase [Kordia zhangzhouensis]